jgi:hypothetical protein
MKKQPDYMALAQVLMFTETSVADLPAIFEKHGVVYRKGKGVADIVNASFKAIKNGMSKTEYELSMMELYLKDVLKGA